MSDFEELTAGIAVGAESLYIEGLPELKESYKKLHKLCTSNSTLTEEQWTLGLEGTLWLEQLTTLMRSSRRIVELMESGCSVFLTCPGDGWDRGCQISSLAQLWMDPYYRTVEGFCVLIEKEWLSLGHPFTQRNCYLVEDGEIIPVFLQWLDAVWQTLHQFSNYFEFNSDLLVAIAEESLGGRFGTFLFDNDQIRMNYLARMNTESLWADVKDNFVFRNPHYVASCECIMTSCNPRVLRLWNSFYLRWYEGNTICSLPRIGTAPGGTDVLSLTSRPTLTESQRLSRHIKSLEATLRSVQAQIQSKEKVMRLVDKGQTLPTAVEEILGRPGSHRRTLSAIVGEQAAPSPALLRRHTRLSQIIATRSVGALSQSKSNRRSSVPENAAETGAPIRKSRSVYLKQEDMEAIHLEIDAAKSTLIQ